MEIIVGLIVLVVVFLVCLIPAWLLLLAYNYVVILVGHPDWEIPITFLSVVCVAFILAAIKSVFKSK